MNWRIDIPQLLKEIEGASLRSNDKEALKIPMLLLKNYLGQIAKRAIELNDPKLNILMLETKLYEVEHNEIQKLIDNEINRDTQ
jgi:hypothetical protein